MLDAAAYAAVLDGLGRYEESERIYRSFLGQSFWGRITCPRSITQLLIEWRAVDRVALDELTPA
jgi:hypothetical protein